MREKIHALPVATLFQLFMSDKSGHDDEGRKEPEGIDEREWWARQLLWTEIDPCSVIVVRLVPMCHQIS